MNKLTTEDIRKQFEEMISGNPHLKHNTSLGHMTVNGKFDRYMNHDSDTLWIGFALGFRRGEKSSQPGSEEQARPNPP